MLDNLKLKIALGINSLYIKASPVNNKVNIKPLFGNNLKIDKNIHANDIRITI